MDTADGNTVTDIATQKPHTLKYHTIYELFTDKS